ncbi:hypothetical protein [Mycobacterium sp. OAE908]|uniref:hypothetical protein n=1 Tax=Mycobacterium sp. OAE908 TaxID=2817899 RepID=UPI001AE9C753
MAKPQARLLLLATYWDGLEIPVALCLKEITVLPSLMYGRCGAAREFDVAGALLASNPEIARTMITHRFPLDGAVEAFAAAANREPDAAIKVVVEP